MRGLRTGCGACRGSSQGGSSPVAVAVVVLQQQLLAEADLLQLLAQFVQLAGQPLTLQLLQHQLLENREGTSMGRERMALRKAEPVPSQVTGAGQAVDGDG